MGLCREKRARATLWGGVVEVPWEVFEILTKQGHLVKAGIKAVTTVCLVCHDSTSFSFSIFGSIRTTFLSEANENSPYQKQSLWFSLLGWVRDQVRGRSPHNLKCSVGQAPPRRHFLLFVSSWTYYVSSWTYYVSSWTYTTTCSARALAFFSICKFTKLVSSWTYTL